MREHLIDLLERLIAMREALGQTAFERACHRARHAIGTVAMEEAELPALRSGGSTGPAIRTPIINQDRVK